MKLKSVNPSNYHVLGEIEVSSSNEIKQKVLLAKKAQKEWWDLGLSKRVYLLKKTFTELQKHKEEFALLESREMGMPLTETLIDFDGTIDYVNWYFDNAEKYLNPEVTHEDKKEIHQVFYQPYGVAAIIVPWNFPFGNMVWAGLQALIAGNTVVFKHSEVCPLSGKFLEDIFTKLLPTGVFNEVYGAGEVGSELVNQDINMISFVGSTKTGKLLYQLAGKKFIKANMEMGGSAPGVIFADANIDLAVETVSFNRLLNQGQCCDGLKRLIVHESVFKEVVDKLITIFSSKKIGNAEDKETEIGPLVSKKQLTLLIDQVENAKSMGAKVEVGGNSLEKKMSGAYFEPTILTQIKNDMRVWKEEVFGPVLPITTFKTDEEAIELANQTQYGLGAYIFTKDKEKAEKIASLIDSGMVSVNGTNYIMPFNPFGGFKNSGIGREHGKYGFHEVVQIKVVSKTK